MTPDESYIEILISKHLDGEISATEQRHLQDALEQDDKTRELFNQLTALHQASQAALSEVWERGKPAEDILAGAWEQAGRITWWQRAQNIFFSQFTTGLAAGLLIALSLQMVAQHWPATQRGLVADNTPTTATTVSNPEQTPVETTPASMTQRQVDWYHYVDDQGRMVLVEGQHEGQTQPVTNRQDF